jgi:hypothetical protein
MKDGLLLPLPSAKQCNRGQGKSAGSLPPPPSFSPGQCNDKDKQRQIKTCVEFVVRQTSGSRSASISQRNATNGENYVHLCYGFRIIGGCFENRARSHYFCSAEFLIFAYIRQVDLLNWAKGREGLWKGKSFVGKP